MKRLSYSMFLAILFSQILSAQEVSIPHMQGHLRVLASDSLAGRRTGTEDERRAALYIQKSFQELGLEMMEDNGIQVFKFNAIMGKKGLQSQNVIARLEGSDPVLKEECIVIGGHYDHLGNMGFPFRRTILKGGINYGADDNASGTSMVLELARVLTANRSLLKRSIIFVAFGAEEQGLHGSKKFVAEPLKGAEKIVAMLNFDMVGRMDAKKEVFVSGAGTAENMKQVLENLANPDEMQLVYYLTGKGPTDSESFYNKGIPVVSFITGLHRDYHTPRDVESKINYEGMKSIGNYALALSIELAGQDKSPVFSKNEDPYPKEEIERPEVWQYKSHLSGFSLGINGLTGKAMQSGIPASIEYLKPDLKRSIHFGYNFLTGGLRVYKGLGITSGIGFDARNLMFDSDLTLSSSAGKVERDSFYVNNGISLRRNSLNLTQISLPLMLELQSGSKGKSAYISAGVIGSVQLFSQLDLKYKQNDHRFRTLAGGSYHTQILNLALAARAGYGRTGLYFTYQLNPFFEKGNPAVYPFSAGITVNFNK